MQQICAAERVIRLVESWRAQRRSVVFTNGCFDLLHEGHAWLFDRALQEGDRLVVAVNGDYYIRRHKGPQRPVQSSSTRAAVVAGVSKADVVTIFEEDSPVDLLAAIRPDVYVMGSDYRDAVIAGAEYCGRVVFVERLVGLSTTEILARSAA